MTMGLAPPCVVVEQHAGTAVRRWKTKYCFDTTDGGRLEPLPEFEFELIDNNNPHEHQRHSPRQYRLYMDGEPACGGQYHYDVESAEHRALAVSLSYAYHRRDQIYSDHQAAKHALYRKLAET